MSLNQNDQASMEMANVLAMLELIDADDPHNAAHALLKIDRRSKQFPELAAIRPTLLTMAGQQSMMQGAIPPWLPCFASSKRFIIFLPRNIN